VTSNQEVCMATLAATARAIVRMLVTPDARARFDGLPGVDAPVLARWARGVRKCRRRAIGWECG
jgi:hypothetical protein